MRFILALILAMCSGAVLAMPTSTLTLDLEAVPVNEALGSIAKFLQWNISVSSHVSGEVTLHLFHADPESAFAMLLTTQGLMQTVLGEQRYIMPYADFIKQKQDAYKMQEALADIAPLETHTQTIRYAKADDIAHLLQDNTASLLSKRGQVHSDARTNVICIQDIAGNVKNMLALIAKVDVPVQQIVISAKLVSIDTDFERQLGIDFSAHTSEAVDVGEIHNGLNVAVAKLLDGQLLDVKLQALERSGRGELISSPTLFTSNQTTASIEAGEEIPYQEVSRSGATGVTFKKAVLSLKVTPQILPGNKVILQLQINQDKPSNRLILGMPAINTRQMVTHILLQNGQTVVLGGIYEKNRERNEQSLPFLGRIPLLGFFFQHQGVLLNKRELLIFVTPRIVTQE